MSGTRPTCREIEPDLVAVAAGEAAPPATALVAEHVAGCPPCRDELERYRVVEGLVADIKRVPPRGADPTLARAELSARLADLRSRVVSYGIFPSPIGPILIARSEHGVSMIEYLDSLTPATSRLARLSGATLVEDETRTDPLYRDVLDYLDGRRDGFAWALDLRWARGDFQQRVLRATSELPFGAVTSYGGIARAVGAPRAVRAVAQALRRNPIPIAIPCHRVIGSSGDLTGYAGDKIPLKQRLLSLEGVQMITTPSAVRVERSAMYVRYQAEREYCVPTCGALPTTPLAELTLFGSRARAEAAGLSPCSSCRPDLHPIHP
jgi:methylated-DNA-[protein]-cysteine S-methyltransferase